MWTALPNGSKIDATSRSIDSSWCQTLVIGSDRYSANAPGRLTPIPLVSAQRWRRPARQLRQRPQTTCPSPLTMSPGSKIRDVGADFDNLADKLMADDHRHRNRFLRPGVPVVDMHVGAADSGAIDLDQHIVDADFRFRDVFQPQPAGGFAFDKCFHESHSVRPRVLAGAGAGLLVTGELLVTVPGTGRDRQQGS